jgi:hypothetical protein
MRAKRVNAFLVVAVMVAPTTAMAQMRFNAVTQFSATRNPHGAWSYLADGSNANGALLTARTSLCGNPNLPAWLNGQPQPDSIVVARNISNSPISGCVDVVAPTDHLWIDSEGATVTVRWTAPAAGTYSITGDFLGIATDEQSHPVQIIKNRTKSLLSGTIASYGQKVSFSLTVSITQGGTIDFDSSVGADFRRLGTGLAAHIALQTIP